MSCAAPSKASSQLWPRIRACSRDTQPDNPNPGYATLEPQDEAAIALARLESAYAYVVPRGRDPGFEVIAPSMGQSCSTDRARNDCSLWRNAKTFECAAISAAPTNEGNVMMKIFRGLAAFGLVVSLAGTTQAAVLATAPAYATYPSSSSWMFCQIRNMSTGNGVVTIDVLDFSGSVVASSGPRTLVPNEGTLRPHELLPGASCRYTVTGSANKWRGAAVYLEGSDYTMAIPAY